MNEVGKKIKNLREQKKMTQEELATALNISKSALWNYENDKRDIPLNLLFQIASTLGNEIFKEIFSEELYDTIQGTIENNFDYERTILELTKELEILKIKYEYLEQTYEKQERIIELQKQIITSQKESIDKTISDFEKVNITKEGE